MEAEQNTALEPENKEKCITNDCVVDVDQHKLQCSTYKCRVHFRCILLSPYQLQHCFMSGENYYKDYHLKTVRMREPNETFQEKYQRKLKNSCNFKKEIAILKK